MERIAIIDLGTNTFNLLIVDAEKDNKKYHTVYQTKIAVKLGEGGINKGFIAPVPFQRGIDAMKEYKHIIEKHKVTKTLAIATSAVRDAENGSDFVKVIHKETGIDVKIISGEKEAELIYIGVRDGVDMGYQPALVIDIGGGSTEFIIANNSEIFWKHSFKLGAARLLEKIKPSDPISDKEIEELTNYLKQELKPLFSAVQKYPVKEIIGSSGSFDSLSEMIALKFYSMDVIENKTEYTFHLQDFYTLYKAILKSTTAERMQMKGLVSMRVDMIVVSCILLNFILQTLDVQKMRSSTYSLKEGALNQLLNNKFGN